MPQTPLEACVPMILGMVDSLAGPLPGCFRRPCKGATVPDGRVLCQHDRKFTSLSQFMLKDAKRQTIF